MAVGMIWVDIGSGIQKTLIKLPYRHDLKDQIILFGRNM